MVVGYNNDINAANKSGVDIGNTPIVFQDSFDDGNDTLKHQVKDSTKVDDQLDIGYEDDPQCGNEYNVSLRTSSSVLCCFYIDEKRERSATKRAQVIIISVQIIMFMKYWFTK